MATPWQNVCGNFMRGYVSVGPCCEIPTLAEGVTYVHVRALLAGRFVLLRSDGHALLCGQEHTLVSIRADMGVVSGPILIPALVEGGLTFAPESSWW